MGRTPRSDQATTAASSTGQLAATPHGDTGGTFPLWIALLSTVAALLLFFNTTVPAIAEMHFLREVEQQRRQLDTGLGREIERDSLHRLGLEADLQSLLVELDKRGIPLQSIASDPTDGPGDDHQEAERPGGTPR